MENFRLKVSDHPDQVFAKLVTIATFMAEEQMRKTGR
jgi:hypothetical protein